MNEIPSKPGNTQDQTLLESLDWFIGSGMDPEVVRILEEDDRQQKALAAREEAKLEEIAKL